MKNIFSTTILLGAMLALGPIANSAEPTSTGTTSVVIVHGAFADGSDWARVIPLLQAKGVAVTAVQNPLSSLEDDVAAAKRAIDAQPGKVVLVGHSWGGTVITQAGNNDKVAALVYVSAFAPDAGQSTADMGKGYTPSPGLSMLVADPSGFLSLSEDGLKKHFAQDLPSKQTSVMFATQGPIQGKAFDQRVSEAAWKKRPSWFVVSLDDHMIQPELEKAMAKNIGAHVTEIKSSHVPQESHPDKVAAVILEAVAAVR